MMQRKFALDFKCEYYMAWYPFDLQKCSMIIALRSRDVYYLEIIPKLLEYTGPKDLSQYFVKEYKYKTKIVKEMGKNQ